MTKPTDDRPEDESSIPPVTLPEGGFQSRIPPYLLEGKSEAEQFILNEASKMSGFVEWAAPILVDMSMQTRRTNGRVSRLETYRDILKSWWALSGAILAIIGGVAAAVEVVEFVLAHFVGH